MEIIFQESNGETATISNLGDYIFIDHGYGNKVICHKYDIDNAIAALKKIKNSIEIICEFELGNTKYRVINENGAYVLYFLEDNGLDSWLIYYWKIHHELFDAIIKALINKE